MMRNPIFALLSIVITILMTSCYYPPYQPPITTQQEVKEVAAEETLINDEGQRQLEDARRRLEVGGNLPVQNPVNPGVKPPAPEKYQYAERVPGKEGFVFNPYTLNQVDVRGIARGTLVWDPSSNDKSQKFLVP